jgi:hypothetical protein
MYVTTLFHHQLKKRIQKQCSPEIAIKTNVKAMLKNCNNVINVMKCIKNCSQSTLKKEEKGDDVENQMSKNINSRTH